MASKDSRLTTWTGAERGGMSRLGPFNFRRRKGDVLLTNDAGYFVVLPEAVFDKFVKEGLGPHDPQYPELAQKGFVRDQMDFTALGGQYKDRNLPLFSGGPSLHMLVMTLRCNHLCHYCHSSIVDPSRIDTDMSLETAKKTVDFIFSTPSPTICIEFQGGEPTLNWPVLKFVVEYAKVLNQTAKKRLIIALVSNFSLLSDDKLDWLLDEYVSLCTSLDGPPEVHDQNRPFFGGGPSQEKVVATLEKVRKRCEERPDQRYYLPGALMTTTRYSLPYHKEIVDLYVKLGLDQIFLRPLSPIGYAKRSWDKIGYTPDEFLAFYDKALDYILELNKQGVELMERRAVVLLTKILKSRDPGFMDLRSPAGAVLGCMAYNYDGRIFVSDEGRMMDHEGDPMFEVGRVGESRWTDVLDHPTTRTAVVSSTLDNQPLCSQCAYKPYCGVEPVFHYETQASTWGQIPSSYWCEGYMGVFDLIFDKMKDPENLKIFETWMQRDQCKWEESAEQEGPRGQPAPDKLKETTRKA